MRLAFSLIAAVTKGSSMLNAEFNDVMARTNDVEFRAQLIVALATLGRYFAGIMARRDPPMLLAHVFEGTRQLLEAQDWIID